MAQRNRALPAAAAVLGVFLSVGVQAMDGHPDSIQVLGGPARDGTGQLAAGFIWDWDPRKQRHALLTGQTELIASYWHAQAVGGGDQGLWQLALVPMLRLELDRGRSPWVLELGVGISWFSRQYTTPHKSFSSTWNFYDVLGAGYRFGASAEHEIGLRLMHVSDAGLKLPNPGEEFVLLRYARKF
jgi:lipid A 3-O-deacylase